MALWRQPRQQPFTTYRDPETGQWITVKPSQQTQNLFIEAPLYRDPKTGQWLVSSPILPHTPADSDNI